MQCMEVWGGNRAADHGVVMPGLDAWIFSLPLATNADAEQAGGDVHFVSSCGTGRIARMVLADVSGHGHSVAAAGQSLRTLMRRYMNYLDQTCFVEALNRAFSAPDVASGRFATSIAMTFFAPTARLDLCNAGHPRPLRYRSRERTWDYVIAPQHTTDETTNDEFANLPLGVLEPTRYEEFGIGLKTGDLVLAYTDAVTESRSLNGELLGEARLLDMMRQLDATKPDDLLTTLRERLSVWRGGEAVDDDLTLLLLRYNGVGTQAPMLRRLWASVRFLGAIARSLVPFGERPPIPWPEWRKENLLGAMIPRAARSWSAPTEGP